MKKAYSVGFLKNNSSSNLKKMIADDRSVYTISLGSSTTKIRTYAFYKQSGLYRINIPSNSVKEIGSHSFTYSSIAAINDDDNVIIPDGVESIGSSAFEYCRSLSGNLTLPDSLKTIGSYCFEESKLRKVFIPDSVESIGRAAFLNCSYINEVRLSNSLTLIDQGVFMGCDSLTSIEIPDSVTFIDSNAFSQCDYLTFVKLPKNLTDLGSNVFSGCDSLTSVNFNGTKSKWNSLDLSSRLKTGTNITNVICTDGTIYI